MRRDLLPAFIAFLLGLAAYVPSVLSGRDESPREPPGPGGAPRRIACLSPAVTEVVFALGGADQVVGVSEATSWPAEALEKPQLGGYFDLNFEQLVGLKPDLAIIQGRHMQAWEQARHLGVEVLRVRMDGVTGILADTLRIGEAIGKEDRAAELVTEMRRGLDEVRSRASGRPRVRVFMHLTYTTQRLFPLMTMGEGSFVSELLELAGGENVFADIGIPYPEVSAEALIERAPDVVIISMPGFELSGSQEEALLALWRESFPNLPAVRRGRVFIVTDDYVQMPGPRIGRLARRLAEIVEEARDQ